jgi:hypothetical protein
MRQATMAESKAAWRPWRKGPEMRDGKKVRPVTTAACPGGRWASTDEPRRCCIGFSPRKAAKSVETGGRCATLFAAGAGTPWPTRPW